MIQNIISETTYRHFVNFERGATISVHSTQSFGAARLVATLSSNGEDLSILVKELSLIGRDKRSYTLLQKFGALITVANPALGIPLVIADLLGFIRSVRESNAPVMPRIDDEIWHVYGALNGNLISRLILVDPYRRKSAYDEANDNWILYSKMG